MKDVNIIPPRCNCLVPVDRKAEEERINSDNERCKHGVCRHLMSLNDQWDNMLLKGNGKYQTKRNVFIKDGAPDKNINDMPEEYLESEDIEGITLTSILFCKHGGLICPVDSGQFRIITYSDTVFALACTIEGEHKGSLQWEQMKSNAEYIYNYLFDRGWSTEAICGVLGNMYEESKMNPGIWQKWTNTGLGYGLVQWSAAGEKYLSYINKGAGEVNNWAKADPKALMNSQLKYIMETMQLKGQKAEEIQWYPQMAWKYVDELKVHVFEMRHLTKEIRELFKSDMRIVVDYLAEGKGYRSNRKIVHKAALIKMINALSGERTTDEDVKKWLEECRIKEEDEVKVCELFDQYERKGRAEGRTEGRIEGISQGLVKGWMEAILELLEDLGEISFMEVKSSYSLFARVYMCTEVRDFNVTYIKDGKRNFNNAYCNAI